MREKTIINSQGSPEHFSYEAVVLHSQDLQQPAKTNPEEIKAITKTRPCRVSHH